MATAALNGRHCGMRCPWARRVEQSLAVAASTCGTWGLRQGPCAVCLMPLHAETSFPARSTVHVIMHAVSDALPARIPAHWRALTLLGVTICCGQRGDAQRMPHTNTAFSGSDVRLHLRC